MPHVFEAMGMNTSKWIVSIGGIVGLIASLFGAMFPLPRILYAMSIDGLIFREFGIISARFQTPVIGTLCAAALTSCFAGLFDLAALVNMLSIGVLLAYTVVAISIIILRFYMPSSLIFTTNWSFFVDFQSPWSHCQSLMGLVQMRLQIFFVLASMSQLKDFSCN